MAANLPHADLVDAVVASVNASNGHIAGDTVRALLTADPNATLSSWQVNRMLHAALADKNVSNDLVRLFGLTKPHPAGGGNQLAADISWTKDFFKRYQHLIMDTAAGVEFVKRFS
jgi:hypothetical protein